MTDPLTKLAIRYGTDKFFNHDYTPVYWQLFRKMKDRPVKMLEIGVGGYSHADCGGESLAMWRDFFPNGEITGLDIHAKSMDLGPRVKIYQGSQVDPAVLTQIVRERGPFDIILDDGSHQNKHVIASFELLFPGLAAEGIYVVEDTQTAFHPQFGGSRDRRSPNMIAYFSELFAQLDHVEIDAVHRTGLHPLAQNVRSMQRFHNIVILHKGDNTYPSNFGFDAAHPQIIASLNVLRAVIDNSATENGLVRFGSILMNTGDQVGAAAVVEKLIARKAIGRGFFVLATQMRLQQGETDAALQLAESAILLFPDDQELLSNLARAQGKQGDFPAAIETLRKLRKLKPRERRVNLRLVAALEAAGAPDDALVAALRGVTASGLRHSPGYWKGRILAALGQKKRALATLKQALRVAPVSAEWDS